MSTDSRLQLPQLRLRPLRLADEDEVRAAQIELAADEFDFMFDLTPESDWAALVAQVRQRQRGDNLLPGRVPDTFLLAVIGKDIVGRTSIRHALNEYLAQRGGHIGYAVRPAFRRKGYATEILRQSLIVARGVGVERALLTCDDSNIASSKAIGACGGVFESNFIEESGNVVRRYWID